MGALRPKNKEQTMKKRSIFTYHLLSAGTSLPALAVSALLMAAAAPAMADDSIVCSPGVIPPVVETHPYGLTLR